MKRAPIGIPGYRWDSEQKRYFLITTSHPDPGIPVPARLPPHSNRHARVTQTVWPHSTPRLLQRFKSSVFPYGNYFRRSVQDKLASNRIEASSQDVPTVEFEAKIEALCVSPSTLQRFIGDSCGWIYRTVHGSHNHSFVVETNLRSHVSAMILQDRNLFASSFGPDPRIYHLNDETGSASLMELRRSIQDVRAALVNERTCVLGARKMAIYMEDIENFDKPTILHVQSDVFTLKLHDRHDLFTGCRNGTVKLYDLRTSLKQQRPDDLLGNRYVKARSIISNLDIINDWQLLVSGTNHQLDLFDLRFLSQTRRVEPIVIFPGYRNTYWHNLPVVYDSSNATVIASTEECEIKVWSAVDGRLLQPNDFSNGRAKTFKTKYPHPVRAMQLINSPSQNTLYIVVGHSIQEHSLI